MASVVLNPYINFTDTAETALNFYREVFGGEVTISRFGDFASTELPITEDQKNLVMHGLLKSDGLQLMVADTAPMGDTQVGTNISISLSGDDEPRLKGYFEYLSEGGTVTEPLVTAAWGDKFGMVTDKFGINWLVNISGPQPATPAANITM